MSYSILLGQKIVVACCVSLAIVLLWSGIKHTPDAAWKRYSKRMLARGLEPQRTYEWEQRQAAERCILVLTGLMLLGAMIFVNYPYIKQLL